MTSFTNNNVSEFNPTEWLKELLGDEVIFSVDYKETTVLAINIDGDITPEQEQQIIEKYPELSQG